ncbi:MAG: hydrophobe/amphiphile efflux-1 family RND transporter [Acidobacteria bacterium]|nr:MAG: RND transporter [Acidobacteria bacterium 13_2_20CM_58_27]PYT84467.1 MAG: hydrophobe/amphiphile efflux-1 family RND transporter [Acidobacteriota bacterium]
MSKFFIGRPIVAIVISIITVIGGVVAMAKLPVAMLPDIVPPQISVSTTYTGADALTIEQSVATPLEQQMNGVDNMLYMMSTNANDGTMNLKVTFDVGTNVDIDQVNTQNRVSQASPNLPTSVNQYGVTVKKLMGLPLLVLSIYSPNSTYSGQFLGNYATINVNDAILRVPGVGQVTNFGAADYAMRIWVKPDQLTKLGMTVTDLTNAVQQQSAVNPAGQIGAEPAPKGQQFTYAVRAAGRLINAEEFGNIIVRQNPDGSTVRLKDVSRIELGSLVYQQIGRYNAKPAVVIAVYQAPGSNALAVAKQVKAQMEDLKSRFPPDLDYVVAMDTTLPITEGMKEIVKTLLEAVGLVIVVVFLFLQNWRATLIPLLAVPVSLIGTFVIFPILGFSINTLSLFGLILAIGLVVDDAIVVVEAVEHHIEHGLAPKEATLKAMEEVSGPVVGIALVLSAVFVPMAAMGGIKGLLNQQFAITIAISVLISAFNALTLSPALTALLLRPRKKGAGPLGKFFEWFNRWFGKMTGGYVTWSHVLIRRWVLALLLLVGISVVALGMGKGLPSSFIPEEDQGYAFLQLQLPDAASLQRTDAVMRKMDDMLAHTHGVKSFSGISGFSLLSNTSASYTGFYFLQLDPWDERATPELSANGLMQALNQRMRREIPEAIAFAFGPPAIPGLGTAGGFTFMLQDRSSGSVQQLAETLDKFTVAARKRSEIASLVTTFRSSVPQLFVDVDQDRVLKQGLQFGEVYQTLQAFLGGAYVNQFNRFGRQWKVYLQAEPEYRSSVDRINDFFVRNSKGDMTPLASLVTMKRVSGPEYTNRFNMFRSIQINGSPSPGYSSGQAMTAMEEVAKEVLPSGFGYAWMDMSYQEEKAAGGQAMVFGMSFLFVFLILAALYESWSLPFSVLLSVPVAVLGSNGGLLLRKFDNNVFAQIGLIMLIGLTAKNAILIVEFAILEHGKGKELVEAALEGARLRLRPILMTSFAFILGCVPLWAAKGAGAIGRKVLGTSVITGMTAASVLGVFLIPVLFVVVERIAIKKKKETVELLRPAEAEGGHD